MAVFILLSILFNSVLCQFQWIAIYVKFGSHCNMLIDVFNFLIFLVEIKVEFRGGTSASCTTQFVCNINVTDEEWCLFNYLSEMSNHFNLINDIFFSL